MEIICKRDCQHWRGGHFYDWCASPKLGIKMEYVTGPYAITYPCHVLRGGSDPMGIGGADLCGREARLHEPLHGIRRILRKVGI